MNAAEKAGLSPQEFVAKLPPAATVPSMAFTSGSTTGTRPTAPRTTNREDDYLALRKQG